MDTILILGYYLMCGILSSPVKAFAIIGFFVACIVVLCFLARLALAAVSYVRSKSKFVWGSSPVDVWVVASIAFLVVQIYLASLQIQGRNTIETTAVEGATKAVVENRLGNPRSRSGRSPYTPNVSESWFYSTPNHSLSPIPFDDWYRIDFDNDGRVLRCDLELE